MASDPDDPVEANIAANIQAWDDAISEASGCDCWELDQECACDYPETQSTLEWAQREEGDGAAHNDGEANG